MALAGKLVQKVDIACPGKLIHETYKYKLNECPIMAPDKVKSCYLVTGQCGAPGSVISWNFIHDGKENIVKEIIEAVDDEAHKVVFKVVEGEVLEAYNALILTVHIENIGEKQSVIWTVDYEKVNESIPDPSPYLELLCACTKDLDAYILKHADYNDKRVILGK